MCGITGLFVPDGVAIPAINMATMLERILHRGPDGSSTYAAPNGRYVGGFNRLAIIDLDTGDQPIIDAAKRRVLMGNGEIYNYRLLRQDEAGYPFRGNGDMEVILPLIDRHGDGFVDHLNGMFALAVYDSGRHTLQLVRDRLGIKPLYWARTNGGSIVFGSEIKSILASGLVPAAVDEEAVTSYLVHGYIPAPRTLFANVHKLSPGSSVTFGRSGEAKERRYWRPRAAAEPAESIDEAADRLEALLANSVALQLQSDVPLGVLLSGGLDSGLITALAAQMSDQPLRTYTVRFAGSEVDETPLARAVARRYQTRHTEIDVSTADAETHLPALAWYCEEPLFDAALLPNFLINRQLSREVRVVLNGTGGDELFAGYGRYFQRPVESGYTALPAWLRRRVVEPTVRLVDPMLAWRLERAGKREDAPGDYLNGHTTQFPPPMITRIGHRGRIPASAHSMAAEHFGGPIDNHLLAIDLETYLPEDLLLLLDRTTMASGVEGRVPFLDHRIVEAALALSPATRTANGGAKGLERHIARRHLPTAVINAPKRGFASPVPSWFAGSLGRHVQRLLTRPSTLDRGWWTKAGIDYMFENSNHHAFRLYALAMLELTVRIHIEGSTNDPLESCLADFADAA